MNTVTSPGQRVPKGHPGEIYKDKLGQNYYLVGFMGNGGDMLLVRIGDGKMVARGTMVDAQLKQLQFISAGAEIKITPLP